MDFRPISIDDKQNFEEKAKENGYGGTETCFADMFCWGLNSGFDIAEKNGFIYLRGKDKTENSLYYTPPMGKGDYRSALLEIFADSEKEGLPFKIISVTENAKKKIEEADLGFTFTENRDAADYVYLRENLATLSGKKYHSKKNFVNRFKKLFPGFTVEEINSENIGECLETTKKWCAENESGTSKSCGDLCAVKIAVANYERLGLYGILLRVDGKVAAFAMGSRMSEDTFITHFEKALDEYPGAYQTVNFELANRLDCKYINREDDVGSEGLRKAKLSYHPDLLVKYVARP